MLTMRSLIALLFLGLMSQPALAALHVCNMTKLDTRVAVGRFDGTQWISEGWWKLQPSKCTTVVQGTLKARYYYMYATDSGSGSWDGSRKFCVGMTDTFSAPGRDNCAGRGMDRKGFFAIDTANAPDYTQRLSD